MKNLILLLLIVGNIFNVNAQKQPSNPYLKTVLDFKGNGGMQLSDKQEVFYFDKNNSLTKSTQYVWKIEKKYHSGNYVMKGVGTYDDGYVIQADQQKLHNYSLIGYYKNGQQAFHIMTLHAENIPNAYVFHGPVIWYNQNGDLVAKGEFKNGYLQGNYFEYDSNGDVVNTFMFNKDKIVNLNEFKSNAKSARIVGDWMNRETSPSAVGVRVKELHNKYLDNGELHVYYCHYNYEDWNPVPPEKFCDKPNIVHYKYIPTDEQSGTVELYNSGELFEKERIIFEGGKSYKTTTIYSRDNPSAIGQKMNFTMDDIRKSK